VEDEPLARACHVIFSRFIAEALDGYFENHGAGDDRESAHATASIESLGADRASPHSFVTECRDGNTARAG
jgi:hypothetical protein